MVVVKVFTLVAILLASSFISVTPSTADENISITFVHNVSGHASIAEDGKTWRFGICTDENPKYYTLQYASHPGNKWKSLKGYWNSSSSANGSCSAYPENPYLVEFSYKESKVADTVYRMKFKKKGWKTSYFGEFRVIASSTDISSPTVTADSRYYYRCFNKKCTQGEVLRVFEDGTVQGWWGEYDAGCLKGNLQGGYLILGDDYVTAPEFGNFSSTKAKGTYKNLKINASNSKFKWSKAKTNIEAAKVAVLKAEFQECQTSYGW